MSLILDALNRADQDREGASRPPSLRDLHGPSAAATQAGKIWRAIAVLLLFLLIVLAAYLLLTGERAPELANSQQQTETAAVRKPETTSPDVMPRAEKAVAETRISEPAPVHSTNETSTVEDVRVPPDEAVNALYTGVENVELAEEIESESEPGTQTRLAPDQATVSDATLARRYPELRTLGQQQQKFKDNIPSFRYSEHIYLGESAQNFVILNGATLVQGQRTSNGLTVVDILSDGIVLQFQQKSLTVPKFNSWINM